MWLLRQWGIERQTAAFSKRPHTLAAPVAARREVVDLKRVISSELNGGLLRDVEGIGIVLVLLRAHDADA